MANTIITKNSSTASSVPTAVDLAVGELAVNVTDKRLFSKNAGGTVVEVGTNPSQLNFVDNAKAIFGNGSDLQIWHDTSSTYGEIASVIADTGSGPLKIAGGLTGRVELVNSAGDVMLQAVGQEGVNLYYNNAEKLATTSTGIDVTGTVVSDGLEVNSGTTNRVASFISTDASGLIEFADNATTNRPAIGAEGNNLSLVTNGEKMRITSDGALFVGGTNTASAHLLDAASGSLFLQSETNNANIGLSIYVREGANNRRASFFVDDSLGVYGVESTATSGVPDFVIRRSGNEVARFTADGLTFNGDTAAANALDDYEEGTWTPSVDDGSGNTASTGSSYGHYIKIGRTCTVWLNVNNIDTTGLVPGNDFRITGLPFAAASFSGSIYGSGSGTITYCSSTNTLIPAILDNTQYVRYQERVPNNVNDWIAVSELSSGTSDAWATITYYTSN